MIAWGLFLYLAPWVLIAVAFFAGCRWLWLWLEDREWNRAWIDRFIRRHVPETEDVAAIEADLPHMAGDAR